MTNRNLTFGIDFEGMNTSPIDEINSAMDETIEKAEGAGKGFGGMTDMLDDVGQKAQSAGKTLSLGVTAPLVGVGAAAVATVTSFDDAMANVQKISGATGDEFDNMREKAMELGSTTAFSASEAADGMGILAASGMEANDIMDISKDMFDLMSAGSVDANTSASILTSTMAQFKLEAEDSGYIVDTFAASSAKAEISVDQLEYAMSQAGGSLASMNMDVHESTAAFGHLADAGLPVGQLGTTVNALSREIKANASEFSELGIDVYDPVTGKLKTMGDVMEDLGGVVGDMDDAQRDAALSTVFSGEAMQGATAWINQGADAYAELTDEILKEQNAAETMAAIQEDTVGGAFRAMKSAIEGVMINIGDVIKKPVQTVALAIQNMASAFSELSKPAQNAIVAVAAIAAAIGPLLFVGGKLLSGVKTVGAALGVIVSPIGMTVAAVAGLTAAVLYLWNTNEGFRDTVMEVWDAVVEKVSSAVELVRSVWEEHGEAIIEKVTQVFDWVGEKLMAGIEWLQEFWAEHGESMVESISTVLMNIWETITEVFTLITEVIGNALTFIGEIWSEHGESILETATTIFMSVWEVITTVMGLITGIVSTGVSLITSFWQTHGETIQSATSTAWSIITGVIDGAMTAIQGIIDVVLGVIQGDWSRVWTGIQGIFEGVMTAVSNAWNTAKGVIGNVIKGTVEAVTGAFTKAVNRAKKAWETAKGIISAPIKGVMNIARNVKDRFTGGADGSHASGAYNIPYDGYLGELHKGEMVLTADASDKYRAMGGTENRVPQPANNANDGGRARGTSNVDRSSVDKTQNITFEPVVNITVEGNADEKDVRELERMMRDVFRREQSAFFNKLNMQT